MGPAVDTVLTVASDEQVVRASYEAVNRGDVDAAMEALAEDAEWYESGALPEPDVHRGREAIAAFLSDFLAQWERFNQEIVQTREAGDKVAVVIHTTATGRLSNLELDARYAHVWTMRDGKGVRVDAFYEPDEALAAIQA